MRRWLSFDVRNCYVFVCCFDDHVIHNTKDSMSDRMFKGWDVDYEFTDKGCGHYGKVCE